MGEGVTASRWRHLVDDDPALIARLATTGRRYQVRWWDDLIDGGSHETRTMSRAIPFTAPGNESCPRPSRLRTSHGRAFIQALDGAKGWTRTDQMAGLCLPERNGWERYHGVGGGGGGPRRRCTCVALSSHSQVVPSGAADSVQSTFATSPGAINSVRNERPHPKKWRCLPVSAGAESGDRGSGCLIQLLFPGPGGGCLRGSLGSRLPLTSH